MLRIALPNKGSLAEPTTSLLTEAGYRSRRDSRDLHLIDQAGGVEIFYLRPRDIAIYVASGTVDAGITGRDLLLDSHSGAIEHLPLGYGRSTFRFAAPADDISSVEQMAGRRVATSYPVLVNDWLQAHGVDAEVVTLDGAVESAVQLGVADAVADVVETGGTLRAAGLSVFGEPILKSEAVLIRPADRPEAPGLGVFTRRLQGVLVAREYVMMDYDVPTKLVEQAVAITPGFESPTVSPLHDEAWVAVRAMVPRADTQTVMDQLYDAGARAILVTSIHACRI